jgi:hypothetical protein
MNEHIEKAGLSYIGFAAFSLLAGAAVGATQGYETFSAMPNWMMVFFIPSAVGIALVILAFAYVTVREARIGIAEVVVDDER